MTEDLSNSAQKSLKSFQRKSEQLVAPAQQEKLRNLSVKHITEILGEDLYKNAQEAFLQPPSYSSPRISSIAKSLQYFDENTVRELKTDGETFLIKDYNVDPNLSITEVFSIKDRDTDESEINYKHYLVTDNRTELTADLLDLASSNTKTTADPESITDNYRPGSHAVAIPFPARKMHTLSPTFSLAHEAGHSYQFSRRERVKVRILDLLRYHKKNISEKDIARGIVRERNASAFALAVARKYRELGVDMTPLFSYHQANMALSTYDQATDAHQYGLRYSKVQTQPVRQGAFLRALHTLGNNHIK